MTVKLLSGSCSWGPYNKFGVKNNCNNTVYISREETLQTERKCERGQPVGVKDGI